MIPRRHRWFAALPATALAATALGACGSSSDSESDGDDVTVTVTATAGNPAEEIDPCSPAPLAAASPEGWETIYCGSDWARIGLPQSDGMKLLHWEGTAWEDVKPDGETFTGFRCYDRDKLMSQGAPDDLFGNITVC